MRFRDVLVPFALVLCALTPARAAGQQAAAPASAPETPLATYESRYAEIMGLAGDPSRVGEVKNLVLTRDVARFTLTSGKVYLLTAVGGRTVAAVFRGQGVFSFAPPTTIEQDRLVRFEKTKSLEAPFTDLVLLFADSTLAELQRTVAFAPADVPGEVRRKVKDGLGFLGDDDSRTLEPDLMSAFLNGESSDLFYAHIVRSTGVPLMFMINPSEFESVTLRNKISSHGWGRHTEVVCQFPRAGQVRAPRVTGERTRQADIQSYTIESSLPPTGVGELGFSAAARLEIVADTTVGPWVVFQLFEKLKVDSARWDGGEAATVFRGKESPLLWVRLESQLRPGQVRTLTAYYRGDLIDRYVDFFDIKSSAAWYPRSLEGRSLAKFDLTFNTSSSYSLASIGDRVDSTMRGRTVRTRWVSQGPIRNASFNLGLFKNYEVRDEGVPPVTVMISEEAHKKLARVYVQQRKMRETVGADVSKSLKFFQSVYGPATVSHFYATEIPDFHGEAFPGMMILMLDLKTMNEDRFTETMQDFYRKFEGRRASTEDFRRVVERHAGTDMGWFFNQWVYSTAIPTYHVSYRTTRSGDGQFRVKLRVVQQNVPEDFQMYVPVTLDLGKDRTARLRVKVRGERSDIDLPPMPAEPKAVHFNDLDGVLADVKMEDWKD